MGVRGAGRVCFCHSPEESGLSERDGHRLIEPDKQKQIRGIYCEIWSEVYTVRCGVRYKSEMWSEVYKVKYGVRYTSEMWSEV